MQDLFDANKEDADDETKKFRLKLDYKIVQHMFHQIWISSPDSNIEDDGLS